MSTKKITVTGRQVEAARALLNLPQSQLAAAVGMLPPALARIESGRVKPRRATIAKIVTELERRGIEFINGRGVILKKLDSAGVERGSGCE